MSVSAVLLMAIGHQIHIVFSNSLDQCFSPLLWMNFLKTNHQLIHPSLSVENAVYIHVSSPFAFSYLRSMLLVMEI